MKRRQLERKRTVTTSQLPVRLSQSLKEEEEEEEKDGIEDEEKEKSNDKTGIYPRASVAINSDQRGQPSPNSHLNTIATEYAASRKGYAKRIFWMERNPRMK